VWWSTYSSSTRPIKRAAAPRRSCSSCTLRTCSTRGCRSGGPAGGGFIYAPGEHASLTGQETYDLALLFYRGDWGSARVPEIADDLAHPLLAVVGERTEAPAGPRLVVEPPGAAVVTAFWPTKTGVAARVWRPYPGEADVRVRIPKARGLFRVDLAGEPSERLSNGETVSLHMAHNQIVTLSASR